MYCIKVEPGRERVRVRDFSYGFLPSYMPVDDAGKNLGKRLVVPGYVFLMQRVQRSEEVPDEEWKVIEAVSDPRPSVLDASTGMITEGPLKEIREKVAAVEEKRIRIRAVLFGEERLFWLPVRTADEAEPAGESAAAEKTAVQQNEQETPAENGPQRMEETDRENPGADSGDREKHTAKKPKNVFSDGQKAEMLARAEEVGVQTAAKEYGVPWQMIAQIKRRAAEKKAAGLPAVQAAEKPVPGNAEALKAENAALRDKISKLEAQVAKLKKAIRELM